MAVGRLISTIEFLFIWNLRISVLTINLTPEVTAKSLLLDLLRATEPNALPIKLLVSAGEIFGISENAIRVNVTRLVSKGDLEQDDRGYYRVGPATTPLRSWVRNWRFGEERVRTWDQDWLMLSIAPEVKAKALKSLETACYRLGFRQLWSRLWIRPNNLNRSQEEIIEQLKELSGCDQVLLAIVSEINLVGKAFNPRELWQVEELETAYKVILTALENSLNTVAETSLEDVFRNSFLIGGEAIHLLALDPLLPDELVQAELRESIHELMHEFDAACRPYWNEFFQKYKYNSVPRFLESHLSEKNSTSAK